MRTKYQVYRNDVTAKELIEGTKVENRLTKIGYILALAGLLILIGAFIYRDFVYDPFAPRLFREKLKWYGHVVIPVITIGFVSLGCFLMVLSNHKRKRRLQCS